MKLLFFHTKSSHNLLAYSSAHGIDITQTNIIQVILYSFHLVRRGYCHTILIENATSFQQHFWFKEKRTRFPPLYLRLELSFFIICQLSSVTIDLNEDLFLRTMHLWPKIVLLWLYWCRRKRWEYSTFVLIFLHRVNNIDFKHKPFWLHTLLIVSSLFYIHKTVSNFNFSFILHWFTDWIDTHWIDYFRVDYGRGIISQNDETLQKKYDLVW